MCPLSSQEQRQEFAAPPVMLSQCLPVAISVKLSVLLILAGTAWGKGDVEGTGSGAVVMSFAGSFFPPCKSFLLSILLSGQGRISSKVATLFMRRGEMSCPVPLVGFNGTLGGCH